MLRAFRFDRETERGHIYTVDVNPSKNSIRVFRDEEIVGETRIFNDFGKMAYKMSSGEIIQLTTDDPDTDENYDNLLQAIEDQLNVLMMSIESPNQVQFVIPSEALQYFNVPFNDPIQIEFGETSIEMSSIDPTCAKMIILKIPTRVLENYQLSSKRSFTINPTQWKNMIRLICRAKTKVNFFVGKEDKDKFSCSYTNRVMHFPIERGEEVLIPPKDKIIDFFDGKNADPINTITILDDEQINWAKSEKIHVDFKSIDPAIAIIEDDDIQYIYHGKNVHIEKIGSISFAFNTDISKPTWATNQEFKINPWSIGCLYYTNESKVQLFILQSALRDELVDEDSDKDEFCPFDEDSDEDK